MRQQYWADLGWKLLSGKWALWRCYRRQQRGGFNAPGECIAAASGKQMLLLLQSQHLHYQQQQCGWRQWAQQQSTTRRQTHGERPRALMRRRF